MRTDVLSGLVRRAVSLSAELPDEAAARGGVLAADTVGVIVAGGRGSRARGLVVGDHLTGAWRRDRPEPGPAATLLVAGGGYADPERAAYINATAACALELDEGVRPTGHPSAHVLPAALAAAESVGASWSRMIRAYVAGYEVAAGLFGTFRFRGDLHPHGHLGGIGAAVAVAVLAGTDPLAAARAAATLPLLTTWSTCLEGADIRNAWVGHAAAGGLLAHRLVAAGYRPSRSALASAFDGLVADRVTADGEAPRILGGYLKLYSACALTHGGIEAAAALAPVRPGDIDSVEVLVPAGSMRVAGQAADNPLGRRFSLPYAVAVALVHGNADRERFDTRDPAAAELAGRVAVREDPTATSAWPHRSPAVVEVTRTDGSVVTGRCDEPVGHPAAPASLEAVMAKFRAVSGLAEDHWQRLSDPDSTALVRDILGSLALAR